MNDIRMKGFHQRISVEGFYTIIDKNTAPNPSELVHVTECYDRVLCEPITSPRNVPDFNRSAMDGYAVKGEETFGAASYNPISFKIRGRLTPGQEFKEEIQKGETLQIMTGAPLPKGADSVLMAEYTEQVGQCMHAMEAVSPGKNVGLVGEDIQKGEKLFQKGRRLRPQDAAVLASVGISEVSVFKKPTVDILVTGDELLKPGQFPDGVKIVDSNSIVLRHCIQRDGGIVKMIRHLPDDLDLIRTALQESSADLVCISGGSAVGVEDFAPSLVAELGELLVHGVSIRPASPTGFGMIDHRPVFLLPGNPVSCLSAYDFFVARAIRIKGARNLQWPYRSIAIKLGSNISSQSGRVDYVRVRIEGSQAFLIATSGAAILSSTTKADGFLVVPEASEGFAEGETVNVCLYDS
ncbi:MAG: molybdopterin molybdotransferase MoeA [SAR324 cluster bacterium]|nr:molybdopterin molybdotransferase MoeA [SAR324 cluster bacterium]